MKFICTQENLNKGIGSVQTVASSATALPILKNILIEAQSGILKLKSTDLEIGVTTQVRGKVEESGIITINSQLLSSFVNLLPQDKVELTLKEKTLIIKGGSHETKINGLPADDFPVIPSIDKKEHIKLEARKFKRSLCQVLVTVSTDDTRPEINGVFFKIDNNILTLAGTDSYRLAEKRVDIIENNTSITQFIVPFKTAKELVRIMDEEAEIVEIYIAKNQILFVYGETEMVSRLIEGEYPNYAQIIPSNTPFSFVLTKDDFIKAVKIAGIFASYGGNSVTMALNAKSGKLNISSGSASGEEHTQFYIPITGDGELKIVFDYRYLLDGLSVAETDEVEFGASTESSPALIKPHGGTQLLYILMPIRQ